jgi:hypothetical protein
LTIRYLNPAKEEDMNKHAIRQWINVLAIIATIVVNFLANSIPLNDLAQDVIADRFKVYFIPAGYVFSIWGLIYLGLIAYAIYQVLPSQRENPRLIRVGYLVPLSCLANIAWIFLWHYELFPWSLLAMFALLASLIAIYLRLGVGRSQVTTMERWAAGVTFSVYLGWITVATIANVTSVLDYINWTGWGIGPEIWTIIMLVAALAIASAISLTRGDIAYMLVIVWAFVGIAVKFPDVPMVSTTAWVVTVLLAAMTMVGAIIQRRRTSSMEPVG